MATKIESLTLTREELKTKLQRHFPGLWMKDTEEFDGTEGGIWTGEGSETKDGFPLFDYYDESETLYTMGVWNPLHNILDAAGWFAEAQDAGTYFIMPE